MRDKKRDTRDLIKGAYASRLIHFKGSQANFPNGILILELERGRQFRRVELFLPTRMQRDNDNAVATEQSGKLRPEKVT